MQNQYYQSPSFKMRWQAWVSRVRLFFQQRTALSNLLFINIVVYLFLLLIRLIHKSIYFLSVQKFDVWSWIYHQIACPSDGHQALYHPWTLLTSLFVHDSFFKILFSIILLYFAGTLFCRYFSSKKLVITYLVGGFVGNVVYILVHSFIPVYMNGLSTAYYVDAVGAAMAILLAVTIVRPSEPIPLLLIGKVKLVWIAIFFVLFDLIGISSDVETGHCFAHLGGAVAGIVLGLWFRYIPSFSKVKFVKNKRKFATSSATKRPISDEDFNAQKYQNAQKVDIILDKIAQSGYDSLTKEERDFLFYYKR